jgi:hypothetical protein
MTDITIGSVSFIGPFQEEWRVTLDGYRVPELTAIPQTGSGNISLCLDHRYLIEGTPDECAKWLWFVANAMAIGAGYSCFGENSVKDPNPFQVKMMGLSTRPDLKLVKDEGEQP